MCLDFSLVVLWLRAPTQVVSSDQAVFKGEKKWSKLSQGWRSTEVALAHRTRISWVQIFGQLVKILTLKNIFDCKISLESAHSKKELKAQ